MRRDETVRTMNWDEAGRLMRWNNICLVVLRNETFRAMRMGESSLVKITLDCLIACFKFPKKPIQSSLDLHTHKMSC